MSTLKVNNLQDINGANNSTPEQVAQGRAKAWVNFNGTTVTSATDMTGVIDSFNVSSVTDNGTGKYTITFSTSMANTNYATIVSCGATAQGGFLVISQSNNTSVSSKSLFALNSSSGQLLDPPEVCVAFFGD